jgi:hypothetical protein
MLIVASRQSITLQKSVWSFQARADCSLASITNLFARARMQQRNVAGFVMGSIIAPAERGFRENLEKQCGGDGGAGLSH